MHIAPLEPFDSGTQQLPKKQWVMAVLLSTPYFFDDQPFLEAVRLCFVPLCGVARESFLVKCPTLFALLPIPQNNCCPYFLRRYYIIIWSLFFEERRRLVRDLFVNTCSNQTLHYKLQRELYSWKSQELHPSSIP